MNFPSFIAKKVAFSGKKSFSNLIIRFAIITVALSISVMIISTSLMNGFKKEISSKIFGFWGHIHITDADINQSLADTQPILKNQDFYPNLDTIGRIEYIKFVERFGREVEQPVKTNAGIKKIQVYALMPGIIKTDENLEGIILKGVDRDFDWSFLNDYLVEGAAISLPDSGMSREILISQQTANRLNLNLGDKFRIHFIEKGEELKRQFSVSGIYKTGIGEYDKRFAIVDIRQIQKLRKWNANEITGFEVFLEDISDLDAFDEFIYYDVLPISLYAESIKKKFREIFEWLSLQDINEYVILLLMIAVSIINMITSLLILILERTTMIGILKSLGGTNWAVRKIFLYYAGYIILMGLFWGNLIGLGLCYIQDNFGIIKLSEENYYLKVAPISIDYLKVLALNIGTLIVILISLLIPTYLVSRIDPVKAIRFK